MRELEFLPPDYLRARFARRLGFLRSWLLVAMGLAMVLWSLQMGLCVRDAEAKLRGIRGLDSTASQDVVKVERLQAEVRRFSARLAALRDAADGVATSDVLADVVERLSDATGLTRLTVTRHEEGPGAVVRLWGWGSGHADVGRVLGAIEASPYLVGAVLRESHADTAGGGPRRVFLIEATAMPAADAVARKGEPEEVP